MALKPGQEKIILAALLAVLALLIGYRVMTAEKPKTAPLAYPRGSVAPTAARQGRPAAAAHGDDPLNAFLAKREEKYPGVSRDIFRMENPAPRPKPSSVPIVGLIGPQPLPPPPPSPPEKPLWQIRREEALEDLRKFRFLGYLTDRDNKLFLSKEGELFIVKSGETVVKSYKVKDAGRDFIILFDTATEAELRVELSGSEPQPPQHTPRMR